MNSKKKNDIFFKILLCFFIVFSALMVVLKSGYYEAKRQEEIVLTNEKLKEYEEKIKNNESIDLEAYMESEKKYYGNSVSEFGLNLTYKVEKVLSTCFNEVENVLKTLF